MTDHDAGFPPAASNTGDRYDSAGIKSVGNLAQEVIPSSLPSAPQY